MLFEGNIALLLTKGQDLDSATRTRTRLGTLQLLTTILELTSDGCEAQVCDPSPQQQLRD
jgi:hypothetical protein